MTAPDVSLFVLGLEAGGLVVWLLATAHHSAASTAWARERASLLLRVADAERTAWEHMETADRLAEAAAARAPVPARLALH